MSQWVVCGAVQATTRCVMQRKHGTMGRKLPSHSHTLTVTHPSAHVVCSHPPTHSLTHSPPPPTLTMTMIPPSLTNERPHCLPLTPTGEAGRQSINQSSSALSAGSQPAAALTNDREGRESGAGTHTHIRSFPLPPTHTPSHPLASPRTDLFAEKW